ncbi:PrkA family serine protein kinase [Caldinitratiruptor microaerophilus]|uniref:Protein PrkA n=1 Tax=Caldinitratiruptor microaerophilus TaxID=671077 RepID=A0AA35G8I2_9FIRM|nr:PrkA family serine protein kinase [Caldinitratiruptor microaerophilus]BDG61040.1 protein PrkA [Caldinitratiruptor microaerophilus]
MDLRERLEQHRAEERKLQWEGTFLEYFDIVRQNPHVADLAHARIYRMIASAGVETGEDNVRRYKFFENDLFGLEKPLEQLVEYFASAAKRLEVRKRILLLMGPVGGGKSTIVTLLKRGMERFSRTDEGAVYAIKGCPMHEEPLHLVPDALRPEIEREYGIYIEGDLCPYCRQMLQDKYDGRIEDVIVQRIVFSEKNRVGIGTFSPSDPKSQDISELTGSVDLSTIGQYGSESDPRAYRFDGELNIANRGLMEFIEMLKSDEKFLYGLLTLSQEQSIKTGRFAMIYADECIISHTNENEYNAFVNNKKNEALKDRIILIRVPYNLRVDDEVKIYEKLLRESGVRGVHIAPYTLKVASIFAILTRLEPSKKAGMSLMKKLKLYNGESVEGFTRKDIKELQEEAVREGMIGISPRYVINRLSAALADDDVRCLGPLDALRALKDGFEQHTGITREEKEQYLNFIYEARKEYDEIAKNEVQRAFVYSFEEQAKATWEAYLDNVEAFVNKQKITDPITGEEVDPDEKLMRSIEEQIGVTENAKKAFREEILIRISTLARKGQKFDYTSHERLKEAIEKKLFADLKNVVKMLTSTKTPDPEQQEKINEVTNRLIEKHGYCQVCANELLRYVGTLLSR